MAYTCTSCGAVADTPGHLCSPCDDRSPCGSCGTREAGGRHVCRDKPVAMRFYCTSCGREAAENRLLCNPAPIDE